MLPEADIEILSDFEVVQQPTYTYHLNYEKNRITGTTDDLEAMEQAVYIILNTERYRYLIYDWNFGIELEDLLGQPSSYVIPELEKRITDALMQDSRIVSVTEFEFEKNNKNAVTAFFKVNTLFGSLYVEKEVSF